MKTAIFHNYMDNIGGAEIVTLTLARELGGDIFTTNINKDRIEKMGFKDVLPKIRSIGKVPINAPFRQQLALFWFSQLKLKNKYDFFIISGDWAVSGAKRNKPNLWYAHSPIREIWDMKEYTRNNNVPFLLRPIFDLWVFINRHLNIKYAGEVNKFVCNSKNTKNRLKKFLNKDAIVINPPIDAKKFFWRKHKNYWLSVNRLISHKRIDIQLSAFSKMPSENLVIVGSYESSRHFLEYANHCKKIKPKNVKIKSWVSDKELKELYAGCKGLICTAFDEDFGMTPSEAMASGKPVIAPNEGGYKETIANGKTGILIDNINSDNLVEAVKKINLDIKNNPLKYKKACQTHAKNFDTKIFIQKIKQLMIL